MNYSALTLRCTSKLIPECAVWDAYLRCQRPCVPWLWEGCIPFVPEIPGVVTNEGGEGRAFVPLPHQHDLKPTRIHRAVTDGALEGSHQVPGVCFNDDASACSLDRVHEELAKAALSGRMQVKLRLLKQERVSLLCVRPLHQDW